MGRMDGKVALVTGGARGQGAAEARLFCDEGARVVLTDILDDEGQALAGELGEAATFLHHDVTVEADWKHVVDHIGATFERLDVLVNNAGIFRIASIEQTSLDDYMRIIMINQVGTFLGMKAVIPLMSGGGGSIVNISSIAGLRGGAGTIAYGASKFAVRGMTKTAALELASLGIRVNSVHPGLIDTAMMDVIRERRGEEAFARMEADVPIGRLASALEVAKVVAFLASDGSVYCTGAEFVVDGGMCAGGSPPRR